MYNYSVQWALVLKQPLNYMTYPLLHAVMTHFSRARHRKWYYEVTFGGLCVIFAETEPKLRGSHLQVCSSILSQLRFTEVPNIGVSPCRDTSGTERMSVAPATRTVPDVRSSNPLHTYLGDTGSDDPRHLC